MSATTRIDYFGASASEPAGVTAETGLTFALEDNQTGDTNKLNVPTAAGTAFSWIKNLALKVTATAATTISNRKVKLNSAPATGLDLQFKGTATYAQPASGNKPADTGSNGSVAAGYTALTTAYQTYHATGVSAGSTGRNGDFCVLVAAVSATFAGGGGLATLPDIGFAYDEA